MILNFQSFRYSGTTDQNKTSRILLIHDMLTLEWFLMLRLTRVHTYISDKMKCKFREKKNLPHTRKRDR